jgi:hypothetical protein
MGLEGHVSSTFWNNDNVRYPSIHVRIIGGAEKVEFGARV